MHTGVQTVAFDGNFDIQKCLINIGNFPSIFKSWMKRINSSYILIQFFSGRRSSADTVVNVATVDFRFRVVVLKLVVNVAYETIGVTGSHFDTHSHATSSAKRSRVSELVMSIVTLHLFTPSSLMAKVF